MRDVLTEEKKNIALDAAMKEFDWAIEQNKMVEAAKNSYRAEGLSEQQRQQVALGQKELLDKIDAIKIEIRKDLAAAISAPNVKPCDDKYKRVMFAGPYGSEASDLMVACQKDNGIDNQEIPGAIKRLLNATKDGLVVDMDALRKKVPGFDDLFKDKPDVASSVVRSVVSAWTWAYYELADKANVNIWSNESMASGVYRDPKWLDEKLKNKPMNVIAVLPPAEGRLDALQEGAAALKAKTGAVIPPEQVAASLDVIEKTALTNMKTYNWPGFVLTGRIVNGFEIAASNTPASKLSGQPSLKVQKPEELQEFSGIPEQGRGAGTQANPLQF